ncbi:MAG TPA: MXAN_6577-like cysteine-rich protein, partial [Polyangia bacterium]
MLVRRTSTVTVAQVSLLVLAALVSAAGCRTNSNGLSLRDAQGGADVAATAMDTAPMLPPPGADTGAPPATNRDAAPATPDVPIAVDADDSDDGPPIDVPPPPACAESLTECGATDAGAPLCVSLDDDERNCGACGRTCAAGHTCRAGQCVCGTGERDCNGTCTNLETDVDNCGTCGRACPALQVCSQGRCALICDLGFVPCGTSCVDVRSNVNNCGACGVRCAAGETCVSGRCACPTGLSSCGGRCVNT